MSSTTYVHQQYLLCAKVNQLHLQQEQLKLILKEQLKVCSKRQCIFIDEFSQRNTSILKTVFFDVLSMVKQLRISTYFMKLSCTGVRPEEIPHIISKLNNFELSEEELKDLSYQERCNILNNSPVLAEVPVQ